MADGDRPARGTGHARAGAGEGPPAPLAAEPLAEGTGRLPVLPLRGLAVFPGTRVPLQIGRAGSLRAVAAAASADHRLLFCAQRDPRCDEPGPGDLHEVGTLAVLREVRSGDGAIVRILAEGIVRVRVRDLVLEATGTEAACLFASGDLLRDDEPGPGEPELAARAAALLRRFERLRAAAGRDRAGGDGALPGVDEPGRLCDAIAARALQRPEDRQAVLEAVSVRERVSRLHRLLLREVEESEVERDVATRARRQMERAQREYYLREQLKAIQKELGEGGPGEAGAEAEELRTRIAAAGLPAAAAERAERELQRLERMPPMAAEAVVLRNYLEWLAALPWSARAEESLDLDGAQRVLDADHHGLAPVKERILEHLALRRLQTARDPAAPVHGPILCLAGPPGCGKTSLARSVAAALGRPFVRISLGGVRDEADIRGHRRTYVGALPGRIITAMRQAGRRNPVLLLDEIDKLAADYRGDPAAALLEVLDPEQNAAFADHYLEVPFDLSDVLFICTANYLGPLPRPLLDRLEVLQLPGYGDEEKLAIARAHLLPRQVREAALPDGVLRVTDGAIRVLIDRYTREAGVRGLERALGTICRKVARRVVGGRQERVSVTARNVATFLGRPRVHRQAALPRDAVGVAMGLAWTETGGDVLPVEVSVLPGRGSLQLTGKLGEVMRESAQAALTFVRANAAAFGLDPEFYGRCELHVHVPEGAVPKDGPSAGITLAAALLSALSGVPVRADTALTGEITLRGRLLPVGGIKEKVLAARRAGLRRVVLPAENRPDWEEIGAAASELRPVFAEKAEEALAAALAGGLPAPRQDRPPAVPPGFLAAASGAPDLPGEAACRGG